MTAPAARRRLPRAIAAAGLLVAAFSAWAGLAPRYGGALSVALPAAPSELDPARAASPADLQVARALHAPLVELLPDGSLRPGLLSALPDPEPGGRAWRLRLRPGLRFHDGRPLTAADVAASLSRLAVQATRSQHGWIVLPVQGFEEVREGKAAVLAGAQVVSDQELRLLLDAPFPDLPRALAAAPSGIVPRGGPVSTGAGPFQLGSRGRDGMLRLLAFDGFWRGRAYADALGLGALDPRRTRPGRDEVDLSLRPEAVAGTGSRELPPLTATYAVVNLRRLGRGGADIRRALAALDRGELARLTGRGRSVPLLGLVPPALLPAAAPPPRPAPAGVPARAGSEAPLSIVFASSADGGRTLADRLQVKLFDRGVRASVDPVSADALSSRLASGNFDVALVTVTFAASGGQGAILQAAWALGGPSAARRALARLAALHPPSAGAPGTGGPGGGSPAGAVDPVPGGAAIAGGGAAIAGSGTPNGGGATAAPPAPGPFDPSPAALASVAAEVADDLGAVPLHLAGLVVSARPWLEGLAVLPDGTLDPGDLWLAPRPAR